MKINKKILLTLIIALISAVTLMALQSNAVSGITLDNIEYSSDDVPEEKLEQIVKGMYGVFDDKPMMAPANLLCIFGHSIESGTIKVTEHNYYPAAPRCKETTSHIEYCTRNGCDYFVVKNQSINRLGCH